ncbi:MAG: crotonase/enoyl-CoA hydratase family protein [Alcanivoracaceae bacterium]|nr:crotonase/enoyl-CoA hydratase family protein [Alcanivoracaceae bacterium]
MSESKRVEVEIINHIAHVSLARPEKHNALDMAMFEAIVKTIKTLKKDRSIRAVIVSGQGPDFCTGLDVKSVLKSVKGPLKLLFKLLPWRANLAQRVSTDWQNIAAPVITVIHGRCWGGGLQIALGADFRIATPDASLSILEGRWGLIPDMGGTLALREHCRMDIAKELAMTAKFINGNEALSAGLVTHVSDNPLEQAQTLANEISQQSPDTVAAVKKLYNKSWFGSAGAALMRESFYQLKIIMGKNSKIKSYNQTHQPHQHKKFVQRKKW